MADFGITGVGPSTLMCCADGQSVRTACTARYSTRVLLLTKHKCSNEVRNKMLLSGVITFMRITNVVVSLTSVTDA